MVVESISSLNSDAAPKPTQTNTFPLQSLGGIMILDNSNLLLRNLEIVLKTIGFKIFTASSEIDGIDLFRQNKSDIQLVIMDSYLTEITGISMFSIFKTLDPDIKIVLIIHEEQDRTFWENLDINSFIVEPIQLSYLVSTLLNLQ